MRADLVRAALLDAVAGGALLELRGAGLDVGRLQQRGDRRIFRGGGSGVSAFTRLGGDDHVARLLRRFGMEQRFRQQTAAEQDEDGPEHGSEDLVGLERIHGREGSLCKQGHQAPPLSV